MKALVNALEGKRGVRIDVVVGNVLEFSADVLAHKYAESLYGLDAAAYEKLSQGMEAPRLPKIDEFSLVRSSHRLAVERVLFVGVKPLRRFGYPEIRPYQSENERSLDQDQ
jgi:hypothetical protein